MKSEFLHSAFSCIVKYLLGVKRNRPLNSQYLILSEHAFDDLHCSLTSRQWNMAVLFWRFQTAPRPFDLHQKERVSCVNCRPAEFETRVIVSSFRTINRDSDRRGSVRNEETISTLLTTVCLSKSADSLSVFSSPPSPPLKTVQPAHLDNISICVAIALPGYRDRESTWNEESAETVRDLLNYNALSTTEQNERTRGMESARLNLLSAEWKFNVVIDWFSLLAVRN